MHEDSFELSQQGQCIKRLSSSFGVANLDQLYVAGDWIGEIEAPDARAALADKFEECKFKLEL